MCFGPKMRKYGNSISEPQNWKLWISLIFNRSDSSIRFQRALDHYLEITLKQNMSKNVFWAQNAQIWLFVPSPPPPTIETRSDWLRDRSFSGHEFFLGILQGHEFFWGISMGHEILGGILRVNMDYRAFYRVMKILGEFYRGMNFFWPFQQVMKLLTCF